MACWLNMQLEERGELQLQLRRTSCVQQRLNFPTQSATDLGKHKDRCKKPSPCLAQRILGLLTKKHTHRGVAHTIVGLHTQVGRLPACAVVVHCPLRSVLGQQPSATATCALSGARRRRRAPLPTDFSATQPKNDVSWFCALDHAKRQVLHSIFLASCFRGASPVFETSQKTANAKKI